MEKRMQLTATSSLSAPELEVYALFSMLGVNMDNTTFKAIWRLVQLNVPTPVIMNILRDTHKN